jgi:hypothetical protein
MALAQDVTTDRKPRSPDGKKGRMRLVSSPLRKGALAAGMLTRSLRRARAVETAAWAGVWFSAGAAAVSSFHGSGGFWLAFGFAFWVTSVAFGRKRARIARQLVSVDGTGGDRESLRARSALGSLGEALGGIGAWADDVRLFVMRETTPPPVDPEIPIPSNPVPRDHSLTRPPKFGPTGVDVIDLPLATPRVAIDPEPPSHPALSRDPDHDPRTCKVCQNTSEPPPFGPGSIRELPPYSASFVPASPLPLPEGRDSESISIHPELDDSAPYIAAAKSEAVE